MVRLAFLYHVGDGVKLNRNKAKELYRMAADRGNAIGQANLANLLTQDEKHVEAFQYSMRAAEQGYTVAQVTVGMAYGSGQGVRENLTEAHRWLSRAAAKGDVTAANALDLMRRGAVYERP
jgi:TPR repeat protein